jgi:hypothetical protein
MKTYSICNTYSSSKSDTCSYCGTSFYPGFSISVIFNNIFHPNIRAKSRSNFPYTRAIQLDQKIEKENKKVKDIQILLGNITNQTIKTKVEGILVKLNDNIDALIMYRCDLEFIRYSGSLHEIILDSGKLDSEDIIRFSNDFKNELKDVFSNLEMNYKRTNLEQYFTSKLTEYDKIIESVSVLIISNILSKTSITNEFSFSSEKQYESLSENIEKINYEIDRLSAELLE